MAPRGFTVTLAAGPPCARPIYFLLWRTRPNYPWHSEELLNRAEAHNKYFSLIERGYEAYLERRRPAILSA
jgi:hypothetical protein